MILIDIEKKMMTAEGKKTLKVKANIDSKELVCLLGHSGTGKTTLLRMIAGLTMPDRGIIEINGKLVFNSLKKINLSAQEREIGFMFQDYALFPNMTVEENIRFAQKCKKDDTADQLMSAFGLHSLRKQKTQHLSGGQKQRVALARALTKKPKILLLDEPLSALDSEMRQNLQEVISKAHTMMQTTTIMVSHDQDEIKKLATLIFAFNKKETSIEINPTFL